MCAASPTSKIEWCPKINHDPEQAMVTLWSTYCTRCKYWLSENKLLQNSVLANVQSHSQILPRLYDSNE